MNTSDQQHHSLKACFLEAKGGTLFLDEAYGLAHENDGRGDSFSKEAIRTLLTEIENNRTGTLVILAGYADKMKILLRADPGLPRRFPHNIHLDNYTSKQLSDIAVHVAKTRFSRKFETNLKDKLAKYIEQKYPKDMEEQNGGLSVNLVEAAVTNQEDRIMAELEELRGDIDDDEFEDGIMTTSTSVKDTNEINRLEKSILDQRGILSTIDFDISETPELGESEAEKELVEKELASLIGMKNVKEFFHRMRHTKH